MHSEFKMITTMSVKNSIFIGEVFQIEVSDGIPNPLDQKVNLSPTKVFTGHDFGGVCV